MFVLFEAETLQILRYNVAETEGAGLVAGELLTDAKPPFNAATQKLVQKSTREGNNLRLGWNVVALSQAELDAKAAVAVAAQATADAKAEVAKCSEEIDKARDIAELKAVVSKLFVAVKELLNVK